MDPFIFVSMAGGLALFLYGMSMLGSGLEKLSGGKLEKILEKMTSNVFKGVLLGAVVTAAIQSSSATTVIVVGLVNAGILKLRPAIGIIMGANIGTTVTGQILRLADLDSNQNLGILLQLLKPTTLAPIIAVIGILLFMTAKKPKIKITGEVLLGFGILFNGMFLMTDSVAPLSELPWFTEMFATLSNPILGILAGAIVTAVIQSSSASVGILQAIASTGALKFSAAMPIILGQNIGTCVTSLISSFGTSKSARRTAMVHLYFNLIGTVVFFIVFYSINAIIGGFSFWNDNITMGGIANVHTIFNLIVTVVFLPFTKLLEKLAMITIRDKDGDQKDTSTVLATLDDRFLVAPSLALEQCHNVIGQMSDYAIDNFSKTTQLLDKFDPKLIEQIRETEDIIDRIEDKIGSYLLTLTDKELTEAESKQITHCLKLVSEFERVGDYTINLVESLEYLHTNSITFSKTALDEVKAICEAVRDIIIMASTAYKDNNIAIARLIEPLEETIDVVEDSLKVKHIERLKEGKCTIETGVVFLEFMTHLERISDHCSNAGVYIIGFTSGNHNINKHEYLKKIHEGGTNEYVTALDNYRKKYFSNISIN